MRAVVLRSHGGPEVLGIEDVPEPQPGPEDVVVTVRATALNRADVLQRMGFYPGPKAELEVPGLEYAGTITAIGERVDPVRLGEAVMGITGGAAYAEQLVVHERQTIPVPTNVALEDAAAIPEVFLTAWDALVVQGGLTSGRRALIHAGASGVGTAGIQVAKAVGAFVAVTCSAAKGPACVELGADWVFERSPNAWYDDASSAVPDGFDVILDVIGGDELDRGIDVAVPQGTIVQVGLMGGATASINLGKVVFKRLHLVGTVLRARPLEQKIALSQRFTREVVPLFETGALRPVIDSRYPLDAIAEAHRRMEADANIGKILVDVSA